jgi:hypothetical protein
MKNSKVGLYLTAMVLAGLGVAMAVTNPSQEAYDQYATRRLAEYLKEKECVKLDDSVRDLCSLLDREQGQRLLERLIVNNTTRQNYVLWSTYTTNLSTRDVLPSFLSNLLSLPTFSYHFETVGLFGNFQTYQAERK